LFLVKNLIKTAEMVSNILFAAVLFESTMGQEHSQHQNSERRISSAEQENIDRALALSMAESTSSNGE
jgi:hypothetical protein